MSKKTKKIVILTEVELRKTISRLTSEIIEKVKKLDNLLLVGIPTRGIGLTEVIEKELFCRTGLRVKKEQLIQLFIEMIKIELEHAYYKLQIFQLQLRNKKFF